MSKSNVIILVLCGLIIGYFIFDKVESQESARIEKQRLRKHYEKRDDSLVNAINRKDETILKYMREGAEKDLIAADAVLKANRAINETKRIKHVATHSDAERDSLLRSVLGN